MTIESDIISWGLQRPGWQQDILVNLSSGQQYRDDQIVAVCNEILANPDSRPNQKVEDIKLKSSVIEPSTLAEIADLRGVNALADGQRLCFAKTGITVIYGDNGSGKSGYARLIKATVNARHRPNILPNAFSQTSTQPSGVLRYHVASESRTHNLLSSPSPELLKMSFYDVQCGNEYLTKKSTISYRPSALTLLDGLIQVCDRVRSEITVRIDDNQNKALTLDFPPATAAAKFMSTLTEDTTSSQIDSATSLVEGTTEQLAKILQEEARLATTDPQKEKQRLTTLAKQIESFGTALKHLLNALGTEKSNARVKLRSDAREARKAATAAAAFSFENEPLSGVGSKTWRLLWNAARNYSDREAYHAHEFPVTAEGSVCVLCQQSLNEDAKTRFRRFDQYMTDATEHDARIAEQKFDKAVDELQELVFSSSAWTTVLNEVSTLDTQLGTTSAALLVKLKDQRDALVRYLTSEEPAPSGLPENEVPDKLIALAVELQEQANATDTAQFQTTVTALQKKKDELQASVRLSESVDEIKAEVRRLQQLKILRAAYTATDTKNITAKTSELTRQYATDQILDCFHNEAKRLRLHKVTLQDLGGRKGQLNQKPSLLGAVRDVAANEVLSEGEQTALGLAGFFTEAMFDQSKSALIFDDPVTSLDHIRRDKVAERLAQLAQERQVLVFTHDVAFTGDLVVAAKREGVSVTERTVERRGEVPGTCVENFPWKAKDFGSRIHYLREELNQLKKKQPHLVQNLWEEKVATWAGYLSETWERAVITEIMHEVFDRGSSQVRMKKFRLLAQITEDDNKDVQDGYGETSRWVRRHDKAAEINYVAPETADLEKELNRLVEWQKRVKEYRA